MGSYILRRTLYAGFVVWGAITIMFVIVRLVPGDPVALLLGPTATAAQVAEARAERGFDRPVAVQYVEYLADAVRLDFGDSLRRTGPALDQVLERLPASVLLAGTAVLLAVVVGFPLGIAAARRADRPFDRVVTSLSLVGQSVPGFWLGIVFILVFARTFQVLPSAGYGTWQHLVLPAVTLALPFLSIVTRLARGGLLDVLGEPYVQTARAKGLPERRVVYGHAVRNMLIPVVTVIGLQAGALLGGAVVTEIVFAWPGVGRLLIDAISSRDYAIVQAAVGLIALAFVALNLVVDVLYAYLDPRIRLGE